MKVKWFILTAILFVAVALGVGFFVRARQGQAHPPMSQLQTSTVTIPVEGMVCASCTARVKKALKSIDGVTDAEVSLENHTARVQYVEGKISPEQLVAAINHLGYRAGTPK